MCKYLASLSCLLSFNSFGTNVMLAREAFQKGNIAYLEEASKAEDSYAKALFGAALLIGKGMESKKPETGIVMLKEAAEAMNYDAALYIRMYSWLYPEVLKTHNLQKAKELWSVPTEVAHDLNEFNGYVLKLMIQSWQRSIYYGT